MHLVLVPSFQAAIRGISVTYSLLDIITQHVTKDMPMRCTARVVVQSSLSNISNIKGAKHERQLLGSPTLPYVQPLCPGTSTSHPVQSSSSSSRTVIYDDNPAHPTA